MWGVVKVADATFDIKLEARGLAPRRPVGPQKNMRLDIRSARHYAYECCSAPLTFALTGNQRMYFTGIADEAGVGLDEQIRAHNELGWKHIELRNVWDIGVADLCDSSFDEVVSALDDASISISCFASQLCNWSRSIMKHPGVDAGELERAIPRMQRTGCKFIRTMSYPNAGWPEADWKAEVIARMKMLAQMAEDGGILLLHENCSGWAGQGAEQTIELLETVDSPALKLVWDTGNPVVHGQDPWAFYIAVKEFIAYVHIKDAVPKEGSALGAGGQLKVDYSWPGEGNGRVEDVLVDLLADGYDGGISIEPHLAGIVHEGTSAEDTDSPFDKYVAYGRRLMALVQRLQG
jgi:sugar phosphate isomerase/epimerase